MRTSVLMICLLMATASLFAQGGKGQLIPTETHARLILLLKDGSGAPVKKAPMSLRTADNQHTFSGKTDKGGVLEFLVPNGKTYLISVGDSADYDVIRIPASPRLITRRVVYFQGYIDGKRIEPGIHSLKRMPLIPQGHVDVELTFINRRREPLSGEEIRFEGMKPGHVYVDSTDAKGQVHFQVASGDLYNIRMKYISSVDRVRIQKMDQMTANVRATYGVQSSAHIEAELKRIAESADTLVNGHGVSKGDYRAFAELATETGGKLYVIGHEDNPAGVIRGIYGENLKPNTDLILLLDYSGSMYDDLEKLKESAQVLIGGLGATPGLRVGIACYSDINTDGDKWYTHFPLTANLDSVRARVARIEWGGGGNIGESVYDGLWESMEQFEWAPGKNRMIIVMGDEGPLSGDLTQKEKADIIRRCKAQGVETNLYPVLIGY